MTTVEKLVRYLGMHQDALAAIPVEVIDHALLRAEPRACMGSHKWETIRTDLWEVMRPPSNFRSPRRRYGVLRRAERFRDRVLDREPEAIVLLALHVYPYALAAPTYGVPSREQRSRLSVVGLMVKRSVGPFGPVDRAFQRKVEGLTPRGTEVWAHFQEWLIARYFQRPGATP